MKPKGEAESSLRIFRALGDETRYRLVLALQDGEKCACKLPKIVGRAQPTVSLQLGYLVRTGLLDSRREGKKVLYRLKDKRVKKLLQEAGRLA